MMIEHLLSRLITGFVKRGRLAVTTETGHRIVGGDGTFPRVEVRLTGRGATRSLLLDPELRLGELYADGHLTLEKGSLIELFQLLLQDSRGDRAKLLHPVARMVRGAAHALSPSIGSERARENVHHHYDLSGAFYDLFLDRERQYSCAYFEKPEQSLDDAQRAKQRHIAAKLLVEPSHRVLDIGSGWGGLGLYLLQIAGASGVDGVTLSDEQLAWSRAEAERRGVSDRVSFELKDYRAVTGQYDRIVSVGMFEHVGPKSYGEFFEAVQRLLAPDGVALLHAIGQSSPPGYTNPWIRKYIFPGGHLPSLSDLTPAIERAGLGITDIEVLRLHYAETLRHWRERFMARRDEAAALTDERFCRIWEFYLAISEAAFRWEELVVFQIQLARNNTVVPLRRGYIEARESELRQREHEVEILAPPGPAHHPDKADGSRPEASARAAG